MANACITKVMMNKPETSTAAMPEIDSGRVSFLFSGFFVESFFAIFSLEAKAASSFEVFLINAQDGTYGPNGPVEKNEPAIVPKERVYHRMSRLCPPPSPVPRDKSPVAAPGRCRVAQIPNNGCPGCYRDCRPSRSTCLEVQQ